MKLDPTDMETQIHLAILKGVIENDDSTRHFGSLMAHEGYCNDVIKRGWARMIVAKHKHENFDQEKLEATPEGHEAYKASGVAAFVSRPGFRWMFWPWPKQAPLEKKRSSKKR